VAFSRPSGERDMLDGEIAAALRSIEMEAWTRSSSPPMSRSRLGAVDDIVSFHCRPRASRCRCRRRGVGVLFTPVERIIAARPGGSSSSRPRPASRRARAPRPRRHQLSCRGGGVGQQPIQVRAHAEQFGDLRRMAPCRSIWIDEQDVEPSWCPYPGGCRVRACDADREQGLEIDDIAAGRR